MNLVTNRQTLEAQRPVGFSRVQRLVRAETVVSGAGREDVEILMTDATIQPCTADVQTDRVVTDAKVKCQATYRLSGETTVRALSVQTTLNHVFDIKNAQPGMIADVCAAVEDVKARYENGHMIFDVSAALDVRVTALKPAEVISSLTGSQVETRFEEVISHKISAENTVTALTNDTVTLPAQLDARMALMEWATVADTDARRDLGGVRVTGSVQCETLISSGIAAHPVALVRYAMPLNQLVPMPEWLTGDVRAFASVRTLHADVEQAANGEDGALKLEAEVEVRVTAMGTDRVMALADAYAAGNIGIQVNTQTLELCSTMESVHAQEPFRATLMIPTGTGAVSSVCAAHARAVIAETNADEDGTTVSGIVDAQVLYMGSDERLQSIDAELPFEITLDKTVSDDDRVWVRVVSVEGSALMSDRIELKCVLDAGAEVQKSANIELVSEVTEAGENERAHGIMMIWPQPGDTRWSIGKKYRISVNKVTESAGDGELDGKVIVLRT